MTMNLHENLREIALLPKLVAFGMIITMLTGGLLMLLPIASARSGGPDEVGYSFSDSDEADGPHFNWIDATQGNVIFNGRVDDACWTFALPWEFSFYDVSFNTAWVNSNGLMGLGPSCTNARSNTMLPGSGYGDLLAPYWDDMYINRSPSTGAGIFQTEGGTAPQRWVALEFHKLNLPYFRGGSSYEVTFEVVLYENGDILYQYLDSQTSYSSRNRGASATIGIENGDQSAGLLYSYNSYYALKDDLAILFTPPVPPTDDLLVDMVNLPDPLDLMTENPVQATILNKGLDTQNNIEVNTQIYGVSTDIVVDEDFNSGDPSGWTHGIFSGTRDGWGTGTDDDHYNAGQGGSPRDGQAMSAGRKGSGPSSPGQAELMGDHVDNPYDVHVANGKLYIANYYGGPYGRGNIVVMNTDGSNPRYLEDYPNINVYRARSITANDHGDIFFTTYGSSTGRLYKYDYDAANDTYSFAWYRQNSPYGSTYYPMGVAFDEQADEVLVSAGYYISSYMYITRFDPDDGNYLGRNIRTYISSCRTYCRPMGIDTALVDGETHVFVAYYSYSSSSSYRGRVVEYEASSGSTVQTYYNVAAGSYGSSYNYPYRYHYDVATDGTSIFFGPYRNTYGGISRCPIGGSDCEVAVAYNQMSHYNYGLAVDGSNIYTATYSHDLVDVHSRASGTLARSIGPNPYDSWLEMPVLDLSEAMGGTLKFDHSYGFRSTYEGAYLEISVDGGHNYQQVDSFTKGGYHPSLMSSNYDNPHGGLMGWTYYCPGGGGSSPMYRKTSGEYPWGSVELDLTPWVGNDDVRLRWRMGYNTNWYWNYNAWYRLDNVHVSLLNKDTVLLDRTVSIDTLAHRQSQTINPFADDPQFSGFKPAAHGLISGDRVGVTIQVINDYGDEDLPNGLWSGFREIQYIIFQDDFEDSDLSNWDTLYQQGLSTNRWGASDTDANGGNSALFSGTKVANGYPGATAAATPTLDLSLTVEATLSFFHSYCFYSYYDGLVVEISTDNGATYSEIAPSDRGDGSPGYPSGSYGTIYAYAGYQNPLRGHQGWTRYDTDHTYPYSDRPWQKVEYDLTPFVGSKEVKLRWLVGWSTRFSSSYDPYGYYLDDLTISGLVFADNLKLDDLQVMDPLPVRGQPDISAVLMNTGINDQLASDTKVKMIIGPLNEVEVLAEDHESYSGAAEHPWSHGGDRDEWTFPSGDAWSGTRAWGPAAYNDGYEFTRGGADARLMTGVMDLRDAPADSILQMTHRYNWERYTSHLYADSGSWVEISVDGGAWETLSPIIGYPGVTSGSNNPMPGHDAFIGRQQDWVTIDFDLSGHVGDGHQNVRFGFRYMTYNYFAPYSHYQDLYWYIDDVSIAGTALDLTRSHFDEFTLTQAGYDETYLASTRQLDLVWGSGQADLNRPAYTFLEPGLYQISVQTWIDGFAGEFDDYPLDNMQSEVRETMFTIAFTDASEELEASVFTPQKYNGGDGLGWAPLATFDAFSPPRVWDVGDDSTLASYSGDDIALLSPVIDLTRSISAKVMFTHRYQFYSSGSNLYDGGNVEISTDNGTTWTVLEPTSGKHYDGTIYAYAYYGNPLRGMPGFGGTQATWVKTEIRLDSYLGQGMDQVQLRWHMGGRFYDDDPFWQLDDIGIYTLGFDLAQEYMEAPFALELDEAATLTTRFLNSGAGHLGPEQLVESVPVHGYVLDAQDQLYWMSEALLISDLPMGANTGELEIPLPGIGEPGLYRIGVMAGEFDAADQKVLFDDLFLANNDAQHMLVVGTSQEGGSVLPLQGDTEAFEVLGSSRSDELPDIVQQAVKLVYDETDVHTGSVDVNMPSGQFAFAPQLVTITSGTQVSWTNSDTLSHTVTSPWFDSGNLGPGGTFSFTFDQPGTYDYHCSYYRTSGMEGTIIVKEAARIDEVAHTPYLKLWTSDSVLMFWAKYDLSAGDRITLEANRQGAPLMNLTLSRENGFSLYDGLTGVRLNDGLTGHTRDSQGELEWRPYYLDLLTTKNDDRLNMEYSTYRAQAAGSMVRFQFRVTGDEGQAYLGGVRAIRTLPYGVFWTLGTDVNADTIFPGLDATVTYYAHNTGVFTNELEFTPSILLDQQPLDWEMQVEISDAADGDLVPFSRNGSLFRVVMAPDQAVRIWLRIVAPEYSPEFGTPASDQYKVILSGRELGGGALLSQPPSYYLEIIAPDIAVVGSNVPAMAVLDGQAVKITAELANHGNYAREVVVYFYRADPNGRLLTGGRSPWPATRMSRIGTATLDLLEPVQVLESRGQATTRTVTVVWEDPSMYAGSSGAYVDLQVYIWANPSQQEIIEHDENQLYQNQNEDSNKLANNFHETSVRVVKRTVTTPGFALALWGVTLAGMLVALCVVTVRGREQA